MTKRNSVDGKVKLTESGAELLAGWVKRTGITLADLAEAMGTNQMLPSRVMRRQGWLTLEQAGRLVAFAGGELTAEMLVGMERAGAVPFYPPRQRKVVPAAPSRPLTSPAVPGAPVQPESDDDGPPSIEELRRLGHKGLQRLERMVDDDTAAATAAAESAHRLVKNWMAAEEMEREKDKAAAVKEIDLIQKFETLLFHARRQAEEAEKAAAPKATEEKSG